VTVKYFNVKTGLTTGNISLDAGNSNITANTFIGNLSVTGTANLGNVGNIKISGGTNGYVLRTDGTGNLSWVDGNTSPGGTNTQVQFNDAGSFGGNSAFTFNKTTGTLASTIFSGSGNALGNLQGANVTGTVANATYATSTGSASSATTSGTVTTNAQPNITSTGTLASLSISGNANIGNIGTNNFVATGTGSFSGNVNLNSFNITSLATPVADTDAATKAYVDSVAQGLNTKASVVAATTVNITLSGTQTIDGVVLVATNRVLVKNQTLDQNNGLYLCASGAWTRTTDMNTWEEVPSAYVFVENGTTQADTGWVCTSNQGGTLGTTPITWAQFSGAGTYTAGTGLTLTGSVFSINTAQSTITSVGTLTSLSVSGNSNIGNIGTDIITATGNANVGNIGANNAVFTLVTGTLTTAAQPNITSTGTLTTLSVSGNSNVGNLGTGIITATGNANVGNIGANNAVFTLVTGTLVTAAQPNITSTGTLTTLSVLGNADVGNLVASGGNITGANLVSANYFTGTLTTAAQPNITSIGILSSLSVSGNSNVGNIGANNAVFTLVTGTLTTDAQPNITSTGTLSSLSVSGNANVGNIGANNAVFTLINGALVTAAQPNITSTGTLASLSVSGNANVGNIGTTGQFVSSITTGTAPMVVSSTTQVANLNATTAGTVYTNAQPNITSTGTLASLSVSGNANVGNIGATNIVGTLSTAAQPNITSTGTLVSLSVTGNATVGNIIGPLASGNSNISIIANGNIAMTVAGTANVMILTTSGANLSGSLSVSGNVSAGGAMLPRVVTIADGNSVTINGANTDIATQNNTQVTGVLALNSPSGTSFDGQKLIFRLQSANVQTFNWDTVFVGSTDLSLPALSTGNNKYDYVGFIYNSTATKWQLLAKNFGF
jgi:hypothetical protein